MDSHKCVPSLFCQDIITDQTNIDSDKQHMISQKGDNMITTCQLPFGKFSLKKKANNRHNADN